MENVFINIKLYKVAMLAFLLQKNSNLLDCFEIGMVGKLLSLVKHTYTVCGQYSVLTTYGT